MDTKKSSLNLVDCFSQISKPGFFFNSLFELCLFFMLKIFTSEKALSRWIFLEITPACILQFFFFQQKLETLATTKSKILYLPLHNHSFFKVACWYDKLIHWMAHELIMSKCFLVSITFRGKSWIMMSEGWFNIWDYFYTIEETDMQHVW